MSKADEAPELYVYGIRVEEDDVLECLRSFGDQEVERFKSGELPPDRAYRMATNYWRNKLEFGASTMTTETEERYLAPSSPSTQAPRRKVSQRPGRPTKFHVT